MSTAHFGMHLGTQTGVHLTEPVPAKALVVAGQRELAINSSVHDTSVSDAGSPLVTASWGLPPGTP